ncbi:hypothetical protein [Salinisphaera sp. LB1]|uniref:hypothetical protein n=1 Tax=Salinisphaera sp. LB1 TaxID=2183911 RepID=UPI000D707999|nr:hypothetical protein [Salinisphaera sp. LB1]AWN16480.1 hypothetical protein SALB1_2282 [Salinisphaera sp. LB1]
MDFVRRLVDLMLFRRGPQDMPGDQATLVVSIAAYCIVLFVQVALVGPLAAALVQAGLATLMLGLYVAVILRLRGLSNRFNQTATALFSSGTVLTLIMLAPTRALRPYLDALRSATDPSQVPMPSPLFALAYLVVGIWGLAIYTHIYRHALNVPIFFGVAVTVGFELLLMLVFSALG